MVIDNKTLGPGDSFTRRVHRGQPGPLVLPLPRVLPSARGDERLVPRLLSRRVRDRDAGARHRAAAGAAGAAPRTGASRSRTTSGPTPRSSVDLGEHVTWYWVGPDTMHSVTGDLRNDARDRLRPRHRPAAAPGRRQLPGHVRPAGDLPVRLQAPQHRPRRGDRVRPRPGDPNAEPDPVPKSQVDLKAPRMRSVSAGQQPDPRPRRAAPFRPRASAGRSTPTTSASGPTASGSSRAGRVERLHRPERDPLRRARQALPRQARPLRRRAADHRPRREHQRAAAGPVSRSARRAERAAGEVSGAPPRSVAARSARFALRSFRFARFRSFLVIGLAELARLASFARRPRSRPRGIRRDAARRPRCRWHRWAQHRRAACPTTPWEPVTKPTPTVS